MTQNADYERLSEQDKALVESVIREGRAGWILVRRHPEEFAAILAELEQNDSSGTP